MAGLIAQGEKGGNGGSVAKAGKSAGGGSGKRGNKWDRPTNGITTKRPMTPTLSGKGNPEGKGNGNR